MTIFKRLVISYLTIIMLLVCLVVFITFKLNRINIIIDYIVSVDNVMIRLTNELTDAMLSQSGFEGKYLVSRDHDFFERFCEIGDYFIRNTDQLQYMSDTTKKRKPVAELRKEYDLYLSLFKENAFLAFGDRDDDVFKNYQLERENVTLRINKKLRKIAAMTRRDREKKIESVSIMSVRLIKVTLVITAIAMILGVLISFLNTRKITRPILLLQEKTREVSRGKFGLPLNISSPPEIGELASSFNTMCERLEELDEMKIDFIGHVSHQLRTPLTAVKEASSMLLEGVFEHEPEKQYELYSIMQEECERLIRSVNKILDLSSMEAGMLDYQFVTSDIIPILKRERLKLAPLAERKKITIDMDIPDSLPPIRIDEERTAQVVENLLGNALKFTADTGMITILAFQDINNGLVQVSISDTGCGIAEEELEKIFEKFKRIESGWAAERGTGLGLSIAKHIITSHGGQIWAESEPGKGSTFHFTLSVL